MGTFDGFEKVKSILFLIAHTACWLILFSYTVKGTDQEEDRYTTQFQSRDKDGRTGRINSKWPSQEDYCAMRSRYLDRYVLAFLMFCVLIDVWYSTSIKNGYDVTYNYL